jgi:hypothetical protein
LFIKIHTQGGKTMNFFNGFGFGKPHDKGCGCGCDNDFLTIIILFWILTQCGCNIDICEILPLILLLSLLGQCCGGNNTCGKPY